MAADYHFETPHILDYNVYPGNLTVIYIHKSDENLETTRRWC